MYYRTEHTVKTVTPTQKMFIQAVFAGSELGGSGRNWLLGYAQRYGSEGTRLRNPRFFYPHRMKPPHTATDFYERVLKASYMSTVTTGVFLLVAVVIGAFGILIREFEMVELIAGYDPEKVSDDEGLARFVGGYTLVVAGLTAVVAVLELVRGGQPLTYGLYAAAAVALAGYMVYGAQRYTS